MKPQIECEAVFVYRSFKVFCRATILDKLITATFYELAGDPRFPIPAPRSGREGVWGKRDEPPTERKTVGGER
ncbi:MAG: hypothetical protein DRN15_02645 [Thermoprotei archaeon]|nr:MAG: hypothetical protein DRM97_05840 [Thermoprotei archaeon]RLF24570.1 MAG: hypothetical protein DRN15_02645 [Thermoprotei archaeon]